MIKERMVLVEVLPLDRMVHPINRFVKFLFYILLVVKKYLTFPQHIGLISLTSFSR